MSIFPMTYVQLIQKYFTWVLIHQNPGHFFHGVNLKSYTYLKKGPRLVSNILENT